MTARELRSMPMPDLLDKRQEVALARESLAPDLSGYADDARRTLKAIDREIRRRVFGRETEDSK